MMPLARTKSPTSKLCVPPSIERRNEPTRVSLPASANGRVEEIGKRAYRKVRPLLEERVKRMSDKTYMPEGGRLQASAAQIGATMEALAATIAARRNAGQESYTHRLLASSPDEVLKKVMEEAGEVALAAKDVKSWATSSLAAALACETTRAEGASEGETLQVDLPEEYSFAIDHVRYEAADVVYHLLVVLERYGISLDEFAAELNERMTDEERPQGAIRLRKEHVRRGK